MSLAKIQYESLMSAADEFREKTGNKYVIEIEKAAELLVIWINYLRSNKSHKIADHLLEGVVGGIKEAAGCLSFGFVRPALGAIRTELELGVAWLFYNDHHVEWNSAVENPTKFRLRAENLKYLRENGGHFIERLQLLEAVSIRKVKEPYSLLSAHAHCTTESATPKVSNLSELVSSAKRADEVVDIQVSVTEYLFDVYSSWYAQSWHDLPEPIRTSLVTRLGHEKLKTFSGA